MADHIATLDECVNSLFALALTIRNYGTCAPAALESVATKASAAIALMRGQSWQPIETAPRDGTRILGWSEEFGARETYMRKFCEGSIGYANWKAGKGPAESGWEWHEPQSGWVSSWKPTHWSELPTPPKDPADEQ